MSSPAVFDINEATDRAESEMEKNTKNISKTRPAGHFRPAIVFALFQYLLLQARHFTWHSRITFGRRVISSSSFTWADLNQVYNCRLGNYNQIHPFYIVYEVLRALSTFAALLIKPKCTNSYMLQVPVVVPCLCFCPFSESTWMDAMAIWEAKPFIISCIGRSGNKHYCRYRFSEGHCSSSSWTFALSRSRRKILFKEEKRTFSQRSTKCYLLPVTLVYTYCHVNRGNVSVRGGG